jgi:hypothetical protein
MDASLKSNILRRKLIEGYKSQSLTLEDFIETLNEYSDWVCQEVEDELWDVVVERRLKRVQWTEE